MNPKRDRSFTGKRSTIGCVSTLEKFMKQFVRSVAVGAAMVAAAFSVQAQVKIAYVDPLSGLQAAVGEHGLKQFQFSVETLNAKGGVLGGQKLEVVGFVN